MYIYIMECDNLQIYTIFDCLAFSGESSANQGFDTEPWWMFVNHADETINMGASNLTESLCWKTHVHGCIMVLSWF